MRTLFFFGTLRHIPLLEIVLGRSAASLDISPAVLPDHHVSAVAEGPFPYIAAQPGAQAQGIIVCAVSENDIARLDFYEGSFAYDLVAVTLADGQGAEVYLPQPGHWTPQGAWSLQRWQDDWAEMSCHAAREVMGYFGTKTTDDIAAMFPMIRARAASKVRAARSSHGWLTSRGAVEVIARAPAYANFFALDEITLRHDLFRGGQSDALHRAVFMATDAAIVLPYDPARDRVLLVEQMRVGPVARGDRAMWQLEPIAGLIDPGETPRETALREAREEAGLTLHRLEEIAQTYTSPGNSSDFHYLYLGVTDLPGDITGIGGLDTEGEDIRSHLVDFDTLMARIEDLSITNAPLILCALWLARHRERLRSG